MSVFGSERDPDFAFPSWRVNNTDNLNFEFDSLNEGDGLQLLEQLFDDSVACVFFDPQYTGIMDEMKYGQHRQKRRMVLPQMSEDVIKDFCFRIGDVLAPSGHLFLWVDKFHIADKQHSLQQWLPDSLEVVDVITWDKDRIGMGYRTRRTCEYLVVCQKLPKRAKGVWTSHNIPDVWKEKQVKQKNVHTHTKPQGLTKALISSVTGHNDLVVDPAAGSFSVLEACKEIDRKFLGCDIECSSIQKQLDF